MRSYPYIAFLFPPFLFCASIQYLLFFIQELQDMITAEHCAAYYVPYSPVVGRCIPAIQDGIATLTSAAGQVPTDTIYVSC